MIQFSDLIFFQFHTHRPLSSVPLNPCPRLLEERKPVTTAVLQDFASKTCPRPPLRLQAPFLDPNPLPDPNHPPKPPNSLPDPYLPLFLKKACSKHRVQVYFKGGMTIKSLLVAPKDKDSILKKVESYTDINVTGWNVMKSTLESLQEHLERSSRNTKRLHPKYMTILTPLVIMSL